MCSMAETIAEIKKKFKAADWKEQAELLAFYQEDARQGVQAIIKQVKKEQEKLEAECLRTDFMYTYEKQFANEKYICGIDEVGRGPLAGPVVACAVILPKEEQILYLNDSKQLSTKKREELYDVIMEKAVGVGIGIVSPAVIDEINILQATYEAMRQAIAKLPVKPDIFLNDAVTIPGVEGEQVAIVKGDTKSASIAAASIVAKVTRDQMMVELEAVYPQYAFAKNKGYGSKEHIMAIQKYGPTPIHRRSFIKNIL